VLWYADIRGFTGTSDSSPGPVIVELLNEVFEALTRRCARAAVKCSNFSATACFATLAFKEAERAENVSSRTRRRRGNDAGVGGPNAKRVARSPGRDGRTSPCMSGRCSMAMSVQSTGSTSR